MRRNQNKLLGLNPRAFQVRCIITWPFHFLDTDRIKMDETGDSIPQNRSGYQDKYQHGTLQSTTFVLKDSKRHQEGNKQDPKFLLKTE